MSKQTHQYSANATIVLPAGVDVLLRKESARRRGTRITALRASNWYRTNEPIQIKRGELFALREEIDKVQADLVEDLSPRPKPKSESDDDTDRDAAGAGDTGGESDDDAGDKGEGEGA